MRPRRFEASTHLVLAATLAITACSHGMGSGIDAKDATTKSSDMGARGDLAADGNAAEADARADMGVFADAAADQNVASGDGANPDSAGVENDADRDGADADSDIAIVNRDGSGANPDMAVGKTDSDLDGNGARRDGAPDAARRDGAADSGGGPRDSGTLLLGGTLPLDETWGDPVTLCDLNGDGILDLVTTSDVLFGTGDGRFSGKLDSVHGNVVGDLNGDGNLDLVAANTGAGTVSVMLGKGDGTFVGPMDYNAGNPNSSDPRSGGGADDPIAVALGDLNGDGKLDIVTANYGSNSASVLLGKGNGTFAPKVDYSTDIGPVSVALGDLNGDGKSDVVVANYNAATLSVLLGRGDGTLAAKQDHPIPLAPQWIYGGHEPTPIALADLNGDSKLDLVLTDSDRKVATVLLGKGDGTFAASVDYPLGNGVGDRPDSFVLVDLNGDGILDLLVDDGGSLCVLLGKADGTFAARQVYQTAPSYSGGVAVGDVNGDGNLDIATAGGSVLYGKGDGTFVTWATIAIGSAPTAVALRDLNADGKLDMVTVNNAANSASVLLGKGDGTFAAKQDFPTDGRPVALAIGDVNGDGRLDLATANAGASTVSLLLGRGDGSFGAKQDFPTGEVPSALALADLNGDGKPDIVTVGVGASGSLYNNGVVSVLLGTGDGGLAAKVDYGAGRNTQGVAIGDMNGDGKPDLVVANAGLDGGWSLSVMLGKGDGTFTLGTSDISAPGPAALVLADLNGDGRLDVVAGHSSVTPGSLSILLGKGDGTLAAPVDYKVSGSSVALGDMDGDGRLDIVTNGVTILFGRADGTFAAKNYLPGGGPAVVGDVNGDGWLDIVQPGQGNTVNVLLSSRQ